MVFEEFWTNLTFKTVADYFLKKYFIIYSWGGVTSESSYIFLLSLEVKFFFFFISILCVCAGGGSGWRRKLVFLVNPHREFSCDKPQNLDIEVVFWVLVLDKPSVCQGITQARETFLKIIFS